MLKMLFQPVENRHYSSNKTSFLMYVLRYVPVVLVMIYAALVADTKFWLLVIFTAIYIISVYVLFDGAKDRIAWKFWRRHYEADREVSDEHKLMRELEQSPSAETKQVLIEHLERKIKPKQ